MTTSQPRRAIAAAARTVALAAALWAGAAAGASLDIEFSLVARTLAGSAPEEVRSGTALRTGDEIQVRVRTVADGYVYVISYGSSGTALLLHPFSGNEAEAFLPAGDHALPEPDLFLPLDAREGTELVVAFATTEPVDDIGRLLERMEAQRGDVRAVIGEVRRAHDGAGAVAFSHLGPAGAVAGTAPESADPRDSQPVSAGSAPDMEALMQGLPEAPGAPGSGGELGVLGASGSRIRALLEGSPLERATIQSQPLELPEPARGTVTEPVDPAPAQDGKESFGKRLGRWFGIGKQPEEASDEAEPAELRDDRSSAPTGLVPDAETPDDAARTFGVADAGAGGQGLRLEQVEPDTAGPGGSAASRHTGAPATGTQAATRQETGAPPAARVPVVPARQVAASVPPAGPLPRADSPDVSPSSSPFDAAPEPEPEQSPRAGLLARLFGDGAPMPAPPGAAAGARPEPRAATRAREARAAPVATGAPTEPGAGALAGASTVRVVTPAGAGSGVVLDGAGRVLTIWHVVRGFGSVDVLFSPPGDAPRAGASGHRAAARVVRVNRFSDLALLEVRDPPPGLVPVRLAPAGSVSVGAPVRALSRPEPGRIVAIDGQVAEFKPATAWYSGNQVLHRGAVLRAEMTADPGAAGAPVFDDVQALLGLSTQAVRKQGFVAVIAVDSIHAFLGDEAPPPAAVAAN